MNKILEIVHGSRLYGLNTEKSDTDIFEIYLENKDEIIEDYFFNSNYKGREVVLGEKRNMDSENLIWKIHNAFYLEILNQRKNIVIDNTNMKRKYRKKFIQDAKSKGYRVTGVQFNTPLEVCLKRGKQTNFPSDVLMKFFSNRQPLKYEEEFDNIIIKEGGSDDE